MTPLTTCIKKVKGLNFQKNLTPLLHSISLISLDGGKNFDSKGKKLIKCKYFKIDERSKMTFSEANTTKIETLSSLKRLVLEGAWSPLITLDGGQI